MEQMLKERVTALERQLEEKQSSVNQMQQKLHESDALVNECQQQVQLTRLIDASFTYSGCSLQYSKQEVRF